MVKYFCQRQHLSRLLKMDIRLWVTLAIQLFCLTFVSSTCTWRNGNCHTLKCIEETSATLNFSQISQNHTHDYDYVDPDDFYDAMGDRNDPIRIEMACLNLDISHSHITTLSNKTFILDHPHEYKKIKMVDINLEVIQSNVFASFGNVTQLILRKNLLKTVNFLDALTNLEDLDLSYNALQGIGTQPNIRTLRVVSLSYNNLTALDLCSFPNLIQVEANNNNLDKFNFGCNQKLMSVNLGSNRIGNLSGSSFGNLSHLESLFLSNNSINSIADATFTGLTSLRYLYLENNRLVSLNRSMFAGLGNLKSLNLDNNRITIIHSHTFMELNSLTNLGLTNNQLSTIQNGSFYGLTGMLELDLSRHAIYNVPEAAFVGLTNLNKLDLSYSDVKYMDPNAFLGLPNLKELNLNHNNFFIHTLLFAPLKNLERLHLRVDYNYEISSNAFFGLQNLKDLDLTELKIVRLHPGCFNGLDTLNLLNLSDNSLTEVESETFIGLPELNKLDMSYNNISTIAPNAFYELNRLTEFNLTRNNLKTLTQNSFTGLNGLTHLDLSNSNVQKIENYAFKGLFSLMKLDLGHNKLDSFENPGFFHDLANLVDLDLSHNNFDVITPTTFQGLPSIKSINLEGNHINRIDPRAFIQLNSLRFLVLSKNRIRQLGVDIFNTGLETLVLHRNLLNTVTRDSFLNLKNLIEFDLSSNMLTSFDPTVLPSSNLKVLNLGHNALTTLESKAIMNAFPKMKVLIIHGNRFPCDSWLEILSPLSELDNLDKDLFMNVSCITPAFRNNSSESYEKLINETNQNLKVLVETGFSESKASAVNVFEIILIVICFAFLTVKFVTWSKKFFLNPRRKSLRTSFINAESRLELANNDNNL